jgi:predicted small lipoprotein YifL
MTRTFVRLSSVVAAAALVVSISGCGILLPLVNPDRVVNPGTERTESGGVAESDLPGPEGWKLFDHCAGAPKYDYTFVEGFPYEQLEFAEIVPVCGDVWKQDDGRHFVNVTTYSVTVQQLNTLRSALQVEGWDETVNDVENDVLVARDYYLGDDGLTRFAIELYLNPDGETYTAYMDYLSPETRTLFD